MVVYQQSTFGFVFIKQLDVLV